MAYDLRGFCIRYICGNEGSVLFATVGKLYMCLQIRFGSCADLTHHTFHMAMGISIVNLPG